MIIPVRCYTRVSTEEQAASGYSLAAQKDALEAYIARRPDWHCVCWYVDDGVSAKDLQRPAFQNMLQEANAGDVILVYKLDRLTRSVRDLDDLLRFFEKRSLSFQSATENFESHTSSGRLFMRMIAEIAQWERETIAERSALGKKQKVLQGEWQGGPIPFGYIGEPSGKTNGRRQLLRLVPDPHRALIVTQMFERYLAGQGMRALSRWLNEELGVPTSQGAPWRVTAVMRVLTNPIYCGDVVHGRRYKGVVTRTEGSHEPLISREMWERVQEVFNARKEVAPRQATGNYPLSGVATCGACGGRIDALNLGAKRGYVYRCSHYANGTGCGNPPLTSMAGHSAESLVVSLFDRLAEPEHLDAFMARCTEAYHQRIGMSHAEMDRLRADLLQAQAAIRRWDQGYETGKLGWDEYLAKTAPHKERIRAIELQLAKAKEQPAPPSRAALASFVVDFSRSWAHLQPPERKALLQQFVRAFSHSILLYPGRRAELRPVSAEPLPRSLASAPGERGDKTLVLQAATGRAAGKTSRA